MSKHVVVVRRTGALGDVILATFVVRHLSELDCTVIAQTAHQDVFKDSPYVSRVINPWDKPPVGATLMDLDFSYERNPLVAVHDAYSGVVESLGFPPIAKPLPELFGWNRIDLGTDRPLTVAVHAARSWPSRTLPSSFWFEVMTRLRAAGVKTVAVGTTRDLVTGPQSKSTLHWTASVIASCDVLVASDSALLHVAAATGTPAVGLYTSVRPERRVPPGAQVTALLPEGLDCIGCLERQPAPCTNLTTCERRDHACVWRFDAATVVETVMRVAVAVAARTA